MHLKITHRNKFKKFKQVRAEYLRKVLKETKGALVRTAEITGLSERTISTFKREEKKK